MAGYDLGALNVLVVEDSMGMRVLMRQVLKNLGVKNILEASSGPEALELLATHSIDIVFTDYRMEPMDGVQLTREIRGGKVKKVDRYVPIIMVSGYTQAEKVLEARDSGINEFLAKPFSAKFLFYRIRAVIESPRPFVRSQEFFGPDRRRRPVDGLSEERRNRKYQYRGARARNGARAA